VQNKVDLVTEAEAKKHYRQIKKFIKGTILEKAPIIPVSAQQKIGIEKVLEAIQRFLPTPERVEGKLKMLVARSFDINRPGTEVDKLKGGVLGGAVVRGKIKINDKIEIAPGTLVKERWQTLCTKVVGLQKAKMNLKEAGPGGLLGVMTELDPLLTKSDGLVGNVVGLPGQLPPIRWDLEVEIKLLRRLVGIKKEEVVKPLIKGENLMINVGTAKSIAEVTEIKDDHLKLRLKIPICAELAEHLVISRQIAGRWRLIGYGKIVA